MKAAVSTSYGPPDVVQIKDAENLNYMASKPETTYAIAL